VLLGRALVLGCVGDEQCIQGFGGKYLGKRQSERHRHRWQDIFYIIYIYFNVHIHYN